MARTPNPYTAFAKAKNAADVARRAAARTSDLAVKAAEALERAEVAAARRDAAEIDEQDALVALQAAIAGTHTDTDEVAGE